MSISSQQLIFSNKKRVYMSKTAFFILFWTVILGPFELFVLGLSLEAVILIRIFAVATNLLWYRYWFERSFWREDLVISRVSRMVTMKFLVNVTNFSLLYVLSIMLMDIHQIPIHFTLAGFAKKVMYVTMFAILLTAPYEKLLNYFGFEENNPSEVDFASDI